jgi:hypothetical protein
LGGFHHGDTGIMGGIEQRKAIDNKSKFHGFVSIEILEIKF